MPTRISSLLRGRVTAGRAPRHDTTITPRSARTMDIKTTAEALSIEDEGIVVEIDDENDEPAWFGGTLVSTDPDTKEEVWEGRERVTITVAGMNSKRYRKADAWQRKHMRSFGGSMTGDEQLSVQSQFVARCTIRWAGFTKAGQPLPFTTDNATELYTSLPFVQRKVERGMGAPSRNFKRPSAS